jgi:hypothetical protein
VTFESGSRLERIEEFALSRSGLKSILIPSSVIVLGKHSFYECKSLESVTFESGSRLERIEEYAFYHSGLKSIEIPSSVVVLDKKSFSECKSLESVTFESGSRLERIEECAFYPSGLKSIELPSSVVLGELSFCERTRLKRIDKSTFQDSRHVSSSGIIKPAVKDQDVYSRSLRSCTSC